MPYLKFESSGFSMSWGNKNPFGCNCFRIFVGTKHPKSTKTLTSWKASIGKQKQKPKDASQNSNSSRVYLERETLQWTSENWLKHLRIKESSCHQFYCSFKFPPVSSIRGWVPSKEALSTHHQWFYPIIIILELEQLRTMTEFGKQHCLEKVGEVCYQHVQFPTKKIIL